MLAVDYQAKLEQLLQSISWNIQIPEAWSGFFKTRAGQPYLPMINVIIRG